MAFQSNSLPTTLPLQESIKKLSKFFGLYTIEDLAGRIALSELQGQSISGSQDIPQPSEHITKLIQLLIDTSSGGYSSNDLVNSINKILLSENELEHNGSLTEKINEIIQIIYGAGDGINANPSVNSGVLRGSTNRAKDSVQEILGSTTINSNLSSPNRDTAPSLSGIIINSVRVLPIHKNVNAVTIFMNSIPNLEISRCVPYLDVQFQFGRPPVNGNGFVQTAGLIKFLDGAAESISGVKRLMLDANMVSGSQINGSNEQYTVAGMEMFTAPQTLVNANEENGNNFNSINRSTPVLDKFRPFMTFKGISIDVQPSAGSMCYKTAKMDFVLHDRSRISEISDFIKPDLYSTTEILIEYGWSHPEGSLSNNPYANLLNGMRCREKYGIVNTSMNFDDAGQANISLSLAMRGSSDFRTETISSEESGTGDIIRNIRELSTQISELRRRTFQNNSPGTREIRGIQILNAAGDANGQLLLTPELTRELSSFRAALRNTQNPNAQSLLNKLNELYGVGPNGQGGRVASLRSTIQRNIANKLAKLSRGGVDPFSTNATANNPEGSRGGRRNIQYDRNSQVSINEADRILSELSVRPSLSLGSILLAFIGQPLAMSHKFDDVQLVFYPLNQYAGFANTLNIANFQVDTRYFLKEYTRYRMESAARAADMSLSDFITFVAQVIIEDPAAPSYGLRNPGGRGPWWRSPENGSEPAESTAADSLALQTRLENLLRTQTPNGEFRLPQIDYIIECIPRSKDSIPEGSSSSGSEVFSILKIHIFDKNTTSYDSQAALLEANQDDVLRNIGSFPIRTGGNPGVRQEQELVANGIIASAKNSDLITQIQGSNPPSFRINGGPGKLREFMMKTSPYILAGAQGSAIKSANLSTIQDPALSTVNLLRSYQSDPQEPNGEGPGGMPLQVIPCELSMTAFGCPLLEYMTKFFVNFNTGTTIDNFYYVTGISHRIELGSFVSDIKFSPYDGWGRYRSLLETIRAAQNTLNEINQTSPTGENS